MGAHRKPKSKPTAFAAVVTAAIVVPAGTAAAATFGGLGSPAGGGAGNHTATGSPTIVPKPRASATSATPRRLTVAVATPSASASSSTSAAKATASASPAAKAPASTAPAPTASATPADPYKNVTLAALEPTGLYGGQQYFTPSSAQWANAKTIVSVAKQRGLPPYAAVIAIATAMQESSLTNLTSASNYDSLGLFQQRPSMGWGTAAQVTDPVYATNAFFSALETYAPSYATQALWVSAQAVQRSGLPTAYAQWEAQSAKIVLAVLNGTV
jgi:hypothetical protein